MDGNGRGEIQDGRIAISTVQVAKVLNQTVKRNIERFPNDFRFELSKEECLRSQIVTSWGKKTLQHLAVDLKNEYPERKGFSVRNMQCMMQFYNEYNKELTMVKVGNIPITQSMIAQLKNNVITFNGRLSIPRAAYFLFALTHNISP